LEGSEDFADFIPDDEGIFQGMGPGFASTEGHPANVLGR